MINIIERTLQNGGMNGEDLHIEAQWLADHAFEAFVKENHLEERLLPWSDSNGIDIYYFDGTAEELMDMSMPSECDGYVILEEQLNTGAVRRSMTTRAEVFGWPVIIPLFYIELKAELQEAGMI